MNHSLCNCKLKVKDFFFLQKTGGGRTENQHRPSRDVHTAERTGGHQRGYPLLSGTKNSGTLSGYPLDRENGQTKFPLRENTGNLVCSGCKFPDFKDKKDILKFAANPPPPPPPPKKKKKKGSLIRLSSQFCVYCSHKSYKLPQGKLAFGQGKHREFENAI